MRENGLDVFVSARSVAIIGASDDPKRIGGRPIDFLRRAGFDGGVYPVNPKYAEVQGLRCYPALAAVPEPVDVVIVSVPARDVVAALRESAEKGAKGAIVYSSGFAEVGAEGGALQDEITRVAREVGVRVIGPNCQGLAAFHRRLNLSFSSTLIDLGPPGHVALVAQSGAVGGMLYALLRERGVGLSHWISSGNEADISIAECLEFFAGDPHTRVVGAYVENMREGRRLLDAVSRAREAGKAVVLLRTGRSAQAARAARSHTGAMAAEDRVARVLLARAGAVDASDLHELVDCLELFSRTPEPPGPRIGLLTNSGGLGVIMADACADLGLDLPPLSDGLQRALREFLPAFGATANPVDVTAQMLSDHALLSRSMEALRDAAELDVVVVALTMLTRLYPVDRIAADLIRLSREASRPILVCWVGGVAEVVETLRGAGVPVFTDPTRCLRALATLVRHGAAPRRRVATATEVASPSRPADTVLGLLGTGGGPLDEYDSKSVIRAYGVPAVTERLATTPESAAAAADQIGYPVALKVCAAAIPHKSDHGLVTLDLRSAADVEAACREMEAVVRRAFREPPEHRWLVQRMAPTGGVEVVLGAKRDPIFGPVVMVGLGGVFVEYFQDVAFGRAPVDGEQASVMVRSLRAYPLLAGARGRPATDEAALVQALVDLSRCAFDLRERIAEVDINPLIVLPRGQGVLAVDALIVRSTAGPRPAD